MAGTRRKNRDDPAAPPSGHPPTTVPEEPASADVAGAPYWPGSLEEMAEAYDLAAQLMRELAKEADVLQDRRQKKS